MEFSFMRKYVVNQQLDEIQWIKNLANRFTEPGREQNTAGKRQLDQTQEKLYGEIQNYLGMRGLSLSDLTPQLLSKFLNSNGITVRPKDIPSTVDGNVDKSTIKNIVKDLSIQLLSGEPVKYNKPTTQASVFKSPTSNKPSSITKTTPSAGSSAAPSTVPSVGTGTPSVDPDVYLKQWTNKVKNAVDDDAKVDLATELVAFLSQKILSPEGAREVADVLATQNVPSTPAAPKKRSKVSAPAAAPSTPPTTPAGAAAPSTATTAPKKSTTTRSRNNTASSTIPKMPTGAAAPSTATAAPEPKKKTSVTKGGKKVSLAAGPGNNKTESYKNIKNIKKTITEGRKIPNGLIVTAHDYKYFIKILETMDLTLKDLGLWRVLTESNSNYVKLQVR